MNAIGKLKITVATMAVGAAFLFGACTTIHRCPRHHPHRHRVIVMTEDMTNEAKNNHCPTLQECLAMAKSITYGDTE